MKNTRFSIEPLEPRIAPASLLTFTEVDGDQVTLKSKSGDLSAAGVVTISGGLLTALDLSAAVFNHTNLTITVQKASGGDGRVAVGHIAGGTNDFGKITIAGDLGDIDCGSGSATTPALQALTVRTMGLYAFAGGSFYSNLEGQLGSLKIAGDLNSRIIMPTGGLGSLKIGGSLIGDTMGDGFIRTGGDIGSVKIGGSLQANNGGSGSIRADGNIGPVKIGGSLLRGGIYADGSLGAINIVGSVLGGIVKSGGNLESVTIGGSLTGGTFDGTGVISSGGQLGSVKIGSDLTGGIRSNTGGISSVGDLGSVKIGGNLTGANAADYDLDGSGFITSQGRIGSVVIGGSVLAGTNNTSNALTHNASITAGLDLGSITVKGSVFGTRGFNAGDLTPVIFSAGGQADPTATTDLAIGKISIGKSATRLNILAGYAPDGTAQNGHAQIGQVKIGGDFAMGNIIAGVADGGPAGFGDAGDFLIGSPASSIAKIASIKIGGAVTAEEGGHFGIESAALGSLKISGTQITIPAAPGFADLSPLNGEVTARLIAPGGG